MIPVESHFLYSIREQASFTWRSMICELIDNAFDASASRVDLKWPGGRVFEIQDDGIGTDNLMNLLTKAEQTKLAKAGKKAINEHVKQLTKVEPPAEEKPKNAYKVLPEIIKAFRRSENKADDLKALVEELDPSFRELLKSWICKPKAAQ